MKNVKYEVKMIHNVYGRNHKEEIKTFTIKSEENTLSAIIERLELKGFTTDYVNLRNGVVGIGLSKGVCPGYALESYLFIMNEIKESR